MLAQIPALLKLKCYRTVWQMVCAYLKDPKLRQAFSVQPLLVGVIRLIPPAYTGLFIFWSGAGEYTLQWVELVHW